MSESAAVLIQRFLLNTMASSGKDDDDVASNPDEADDDLEFPRLTLPTGMSGRKDAEAAARPGVSSSPRLAPPRKSCRNASQEKTVK